ncbi:hypothetical protein Q669_31095 [Labrenzia sp. C1B10]|nr:hypothetical protein Q669_31095 [Labrenzia sp. C1B10]ERS02986.1 hypothetical protein Q675_31580 [Labrenzia sp. C1B70]
MKTPSILPRLQGYRFPREIIAYAVWAYHRFALSTADVEDLLAERGITVSREAVRNWMNRFGCHFADCIKRDRPGAADKWHLDEVVIPINGRRHWLWRAVDANGDVLKDIEQEFAKALGLEDHQRVVGTHINTENFHMHIQFNLVHPETFRMHTPFRDFQVLQLTAAELEKEHGLEVVQGRGPDKDRMHNDQENQKARDKEANSWE